MHFRASACRATYVLFGGASLVERPDMQSLPSRKGMDLLRDPYRNRALSFSGEQRARLGLVGLLPARTLSLKTRCEQLLRNIDAKKTSLEKYLLLVEVQNVDEDLYFYALIHNTHKLMPFVYTPTVGQACQKFSEIYVRPRGMYITLNDLGNVRAVLDNWPENDVRVIVFTDGERILGLGDLGANGMGIPIGKLALYTALAGVAPWQTLPVTLDVGTNRESLLNDPCYIGLQQKRERGDKYDRLVDEFINAAVSRWPKVLLQFEDFGITNALRLLDQYRNRVCSFNDDVQGTGSVTLAGLLAAARMRKQKMSDLRIVFYGAGSAAVGIAQMIVTAMVEEGAQYEDAMKRVWFVDSKGLVVRQRLSEPLADHKVAFAHEGPHLSDLKEIVEHLKPNAIIGVSGDANAFTVDTMKAMLGWDSRPIIFALSNPTDNSECTAEDAYKATNGAAIFASGSPFDPVTIGDRTLVPGQANNAYIFPGVGLGVVVSGATRISDAMFIQAARALSGMATEEDFANGCLFPGLGRIREVSTQIALATAKLAEVEGVNQVTPPNGDWLALIKDSMYTPSDESVARAAL